MNHLENIPSVVFMAEEVLLMHRELKQLRLENEQLREYRDKYTALLDDSIGHGRKLMGNVLAAILEKTA